MNKKILIGVFSVFGVAIIAALAILLINQQNEIKNLKQEVSKNSTSSSEVKTEVKNDASTVTTTVSKKTFESKYSNLKFEYPESWTLSESQDVKSLQKGYEEYQYYTTLKSKSGKEVVLREAFNGGYGAGCDGGARTVDSSNVGASKIAGYSVFEVVDGDSVSFFATSNDFTTGKVQYCQAVARNLIVGNANSVIKFNNGDPIIASFTYDGKIASLSSEEGKEIIEILASLSLK